MTTDARKRLDGWKQIAEYLKRDVTTVIRWEREKGLPVHRISGGKRQAVFAYLEDIDHWLSDPPRNGERPTAYDPQDVFAAGDTVQAMDSARLSEEFLEGCGPTNPQKLNTTQVISEETLPGDHSPVAGMMSDPLVRQEFDCEYPLQQFSPAAPRFFLAKLLAHPILILFFLAATTIASLALFLRWQPASATVSKISPITNDGVEKRLLPFTDGVRIYFEESFPLKSVIKAVPTAGGEIIDVPMPVKNPFLVNIFPDGSGLLVADYYSPGPEIWKVPLFGGSPFPILGIHSLYLDWSLSREKFVYVEDEGHSLSIASLDGTGRQKLVTLASQSIICPRWSPDGRIIRFTVTDPNHTGSTTELWQIDSDGSNAGPLLARWNNPPRESTGNWSLDGKFYVFSSQRDGRSDIWAFREKSIRWFSHSTYEPIRLTNGPMDFFDPVASPDGKKIFFYGRQVHGELVRYDPRSRILSPFLSGISAGTANCSRDGQWIAYLSYPENTLWRSRIDGREKQQLVFAPWESDSPHWSPDGRTIAFRAALPGHRRKIFLISRDGGNAQELLPERNEEDGVPTWSPDGRFLLFGEISWKLDKIALHIVDWRTRSVSTVPGSTGLWTPRWSPDGRFIAALTRDSNSLLIYDFRSQKWRTLLLHFVEDPIWSHDGKYIYFRTNENVKNPSVFRVDVSSGTLERVLDFSSFPGVYPHPVTLAPDDSILTTRDTHQIEIYSLDVQWP